MRVSTTDGHDYRIKRDGDSGWIHVSGSQVALNTFIDTVALTGTEESDENRPTGVDLRRDPDSPSDRILRVREGTVALWLQFECLNYL